MNKACFNLTLPLLLSAVIKCVSDFNVLVSPGRLVTIGTFDLTPSDGGPRSAGWRDHSAPGESRRRKFDFDFRDSDGRGGGGGGRRRAGSEGMEDDRDGLPEWCTDEEEGDLGTFDSSGAFMPLKVGEVGEGGVWPLPAKKIMGSIPNLVGSCTHGFCLLACI